MTRHRCTPVLDFFRYFLSLGGMVPPVAALIGNKKEIVSMKKNRERSALSPIGRRAITPWARSEIKRRKRILAKLDVLLSAGMSLKKASKKLRVNCVTLWRYRQNIQPATGFCGRRSALEKFKIPKSLVELVQRLQLAGRSNVAAWREVAKNRRCPEALARFLGAARFIPPSLVKATRLKKETITVLRGNNFVMVQDAP
jgi:hypothetical protein